VNEKHCGRWLMVVGASARQ